MSASSPGFPTFEIEAWLRARGFAETTSASELKDRPAVEYAMDPTVKKTHQLLVRAGADLELFERVAARLGADRVTVAATQAHATIAGQTFTAEGWTFRGARLMLALAGFDYDGPAHLPSTNARVALFHNVHCAGYEISPYVLVRDNVACLALRECWPSVVRAPTTPIQ